MSFKDSRMVKDWNGKLLFAILFQFVFTNNIVKVYFFNFNGSYGCGGGDTNGSYGCGGDYTNGSYGCGGGDTN